MMDCWVEWDLYDDDYDQTKRLHFLLDQWDDDDYDQIIGSIFSSTLCVCIYIYYLKLGQKSLSENGGG